MLVAVPDAEPSGVGLGDVEVASAGGEEDAVGWVEPVGVEVSGVGLDVGVGDSDGDGNGGCSNVCVEEDVLDAFSPSNKLGIMLHSPGVCTKAPCVIVTQYGCFVTVSYKVMPFGLSELPTVNESTLIPPLNIALPKSSIASTGVEEDDGGPVAPKLMDIWSGPARMKSNFPPSAILKVIFLSTGSIASTTKVPVNTLGEITSSPAISRSVLISESVELAVISCLWLNIWAKMRRPISTVAGMESISTP